MEKLDQGHLFKQNTLPICPPCSTRQKLIDSGTRTLLTYVNVSTWTGGGSRTSTSQPISSPNILQASGLRDRFESGSGRRLLARLTADEWTSLTLKPGRALTLLQWLKKKWTVTFISLIINRDHLSRQSPQSKQCKQNIIFIKTKTGLGSWVCWGFSGRTHWSGKIRF